MPTDPTDGEDMSSSEPTPPSISQLIRAFMDRTGFSQHAIARRASIDGEQVTQRYVGDLVNGKTRAWPDRSEVFTGLAVALETTPTAVVLAFAVERGLPVQTSWFAARLPAGVDSLPSAIQDSALAHLRALVADRAEESLASSDLVVDGDAVSGDGVEDRDGWDVQRSPSDQAEH